jgi:D-sedoheptulose 7-phosphate isomerase
MILKKQESIDKFIKIYFEHLNYIFKNIDRNKIKNLSLLLEKSRKNNSNVFVVGNGGSAVNATAMSNDLGFDILKKTKKKTFKVFSLTDNNAISTAISNDIGFENIFTSQLKILFEKNDLLIVMSVSGNSKNLLNCAKWVRKKQGKVFGILGCNGGKLKRFCNDSIIIPSKIGEFGPVEDLQLIINHILAHWFQITLQK